MTFHPDTLPRAEGGYHTVARLAEHGAHGYMGARSPTKAAEAVTRIKDEYPLAHIDVLQMDFMDLKSVVAAAQLVLTLEPALHGLVNNAGIMATPFEMTRDGHEAQWQTNYLAHWLLTEKLLPLMIQTARALRPGSVRVVNLTSSGHLGAPKGGINFDDLSLIKEDSPWARYGQSKLASILHTRTLNSRHGPGSLSARNRGGEIWVSSVHPGLVEKNLASPLEGTGSGMLMLFSCFRAFGMISTADKGSWTSLFCVASQDMKAEQSGTYIEIFGRLTEP